MDRQLKKFTDPSQAKNEESKRELLALCYGTEGIHFKVDVCTVKNYITVVNLLHHAFPLKVGCIKRFAILVS